MVSPEYFASLQILDHPIGESCDVARGLKHGSGGHDSGVYFEHVFFHDEVFPPFRDDVTLKR